MAQYYKITKIGLVIGSLFLFVACSTNKYAATEKIYKNKAKAFSEIIKTVPPPGQKVDGLDPALQSWVGSINFGIRKPNFVIIHHTAQNSLQQTINTFIVKGKSEVSSHYVVGKDGAVVQMVNDYLRANHAGIGRWGNTNDLNSSSIGIELDNNGIDQPFSDAQIKSLIALLDALKKRYNIPTANFIGHADIAPGRKNDPKNFPWKVLAKQGFGLWYDDVLNLPPADFNAELALRIIGYDTRNLPAAIEAFKIHFVQTDITQVLTPADKLILFNLYKKYM
ncbi:MAG: N-acetylmuramoyl-L-alanine amidase [Candidatus Pedobacter colombiensis]|uniref:N-acetylmuramoyl-L-alanine amidase n=1 Tax=Candidatus Pedobacter colombiensis TaxID=3121371 RepID=A0AAJ5W741_9SPHI|nr:N-acetylmuramoyl-L-alanine amidase [Pedobacter sp.]WEK19267.1 MAG: N-acetylmuramoyl-L-alanine amidase [Pedobacter sp.]